MKAGCRVPAVAGVFYPEDPRALRKMVQEFLKEAKAFERPSPKAVIVPHAGYLYSGAVAASAYADVDPAGVSRVVLIGPSHRVMLRGLAVSESLTWQTPVGNVAIDSGAQVELLSFPQVLASDWAHLEEHCLEVQLPFLKEWLGDDFLMVPLIVGDARPEEVADVLEALWGGPETLLVVSSDLSHYLPYEEAVEKDRATARAIENLNVRGLERDCACGLTAIAGLVCLAQRRGLRSERLDLRNSGDTAGAKDQVVGYGAFAFYE